MNCPTCGSKMFHYENPDRYLCPNESSHARAETRKKQGDHRSKKDRPPSPGRNQFTRRKKDK